MLRVRFHSFEISAMELRITWVKSIKVTEGVPHNIIEIFDNLWCLLFTEFRLSIELILLLTKKTISTIWFCKKLSFQTVPNDSNPLVPRKLEIMN